MALIVGSATVSGGTSRIVDSALAADDVFVDGISYTSEHDVTDAGEIAVVLGSVDSIDPTVPGADFSSSAYANNVKTIACNNSFKDSVKCPGYFQNTTPLDILMEKTLQVAESCRIGRQRSILGAIGYTLTSDEKGTRSASGIETDIATARKALRKKGARPNVLLMSVDAYSELLVAAGSKFTPVTNEEIVSTGRIGIYNGMYVFEVPFMGESGQSVKWYDASGTLRTVDVSAYSFIAYQGDKLWVVDKLTGLRQKEAEGFFGSLVQCEIDSGMALRKEAFFLVSKS